jgi:hypothetical protein
MFENNADCRRGNGRPTLRGLEGFESDVREMAIGVGLRENKTQLLTCCKGG